MSEVVRQENSLTPMVRRRLFALITVILVASSVFPSWQSLTLFENSLTPELNKKAQVIGLNAVGDVKRAVGLGIPFAELYGVGPYLSKINKTYPEIKYVAVTDASGRFFTKVMNSTVKRRHFSDRGRRLI